MPTAIGDSLDLRGLGLEPPTAGPSGGDLGQEDFLSLMITQLKNQDPFKPLESGEFLGQLAQFGTVSGLAELKTAFGELSTSLVSNQALQAASLVGRTALVEGDTAALADGATLEGAVELPAAASALRVEIRDASGEVVRELAFGARSSGLARFTWDGMNDAGEPAGAGQHTVVAEYTANGEAAAAPTLVVAPIESVVFGAQGFTVQLGGLGELPFSAIREVRNQ
jgi:flagellar basal-body rod modification protein FlgD